MVYITVNPVGFKIDSIFVRKSNDTMRRIFGIVLLLFIITPAIAQENKPKQPDLPGELMIDYGFNFWTEEPDRLPSHFWGSNSVGLYYNLRVRFNDYISFHPGWGFTFEKYSFDDVHTWQKDANGVVFLDSLNGVDVTKNKLVTNYMEIPVEFRIHPLGTVAGEGWFIGLGAIAGIRMGAPHTKVKYNVGDNSVKQKVYDDFNVNRFRYGVQARFGFKTFHLYYKTYLNNLFTSAPDASGVNPQTFTIGATFSGF